MLKFRMIPVLLLKNEGLVKTVQFKNPTYIGDPINAVKIFNTKGVDELILLDIEATRLNRRFDLKRVAQIAEECFMPLSFGGGVKSVEDIKDLLNAGVEKVVINTKAVWEPSLIQEASKQFGSQSIIVSIDVRRGSHGRYEILTDAGTRSSGKDPVEFARHMEEAGAGEIFLNSIDQDGTMTGYDLELIRSVAGVVTIPVIACGGAGKAEDFSRAIHEAKAQAVAAGSFFVFHGRRRAVLINFPTRQEREEMFQTPIL